MLAIPFALRSPRSGGVWRSIGLGLLMGFACWVVLSASLSLGRKGMLRPRSPRGSPGSSSPAPEPPFSAAWGR